MFSRARSVWWMFALLLIIALPRVGHAQKRVVVLEIEGERNAAIQNELKKLIRPHKALLSKTYKLAAKRLRKPKLNPAHIRRVARYLEADGIIDGALVADGGGYRLTVKLRSGASGAVVRKVKMTLSQPRLSASLRSGLRQRLMSSIDELPQLDADLGSQRSGFVKGEELDGDGNSFDDEDAFEEDKKEEPRRLSKREQREERRRVEREKREAERAKREEEQAKREEERAERARAKREAKARRDREEEEESFDDDEEWDDDDRDDRRGKKSRRRRVADGDDEMEDEDWEDEESEEFRDRDDRDETASVAKKASSRREIDPSRVKGMILAGASIKQRNLKFTSAAIEDAPIGYKSAAVPGAFINAMVYPMLLANDKPKGELAERIGVSVYFDRVVTLETNVQDGDMVTPVATSLTRYGGGLNYRHLFGDGPNAVSATALIGFNKNNFIIDKARSPVEIDVPNTKYTWADVGGGVRYPLSKQLALNAAGKILFVLDAGEIQEADQYGGAKLTGVDADVSADYWLSSRFLLRVGAQYTAFAFNFVGNGAESDRNGDQIVDVGGALDTYVGGYATVGAAF